MPAAPAAASLAGVPVAEIVGDYRQPQLSWEQHMVYAQQQQQQQMHQQLRMQQDVLLGIVRQNNMASQHILSTSRLC